MNETPEHEPHTRDWPEDATHENGNYRNICLACDSNFIGHKDRHICRRCHFQARARYAAMTPEEQSEHDTKVLVELLKFMEAE